MAKRVSADSAPTDSAPTDSAPTDSAPTESSGSSEPPIVAAVNVSKTYRSNDLCHQALKGVDLDIAPGEFLVVVGPSGNGKSTLINCLSGIDAIDSGSVIVDGLDIHQLSDRQRTAHRAKRMGFVFQAFNLIPVLSAIENVELPLLAAGDRPGVARQRAETMLGRVGLDDRADHHPSQLSGGQQQRVAIARALAGSPAVIWADEPTGNLDSATALRIADLLCEVNEEGQTVVVVTHDTTLAKRATRTIEVRDGQLTTGPSMIDNDTTARS